MLKTLQENSKIIDKLENNQQYGDATKLLYYGFNIFKEKNYWRLFVSSKRAVQIIGTNAITQGCVSFP